METKTLSTGVVLVNTDGVKSTADMTAIMNETMATPEARSKTYCFVSFNDLKSRQKLFDDLLTGKEGWRNRAEFLGIEITSAMSALAGMLPVVRETIWPKSAPGVYELAEVTGLAALYLTPYDDVRWDSYKMTARSAKSLWTRLHQIWSSSDSQYPIELPTRSFDGYDRKPKVHQDNVKIGCQTIPRYAIEQFAIKQGWLIV